MIKLMEVGKMFGGADLQMKKFSPFPNSAGSCISFNDST